jgi:hypothetical protein
MKASAKVSIERAFLRAQATLRIAAVVRSLAIIVDTGAG